MQETYLAHHGVKGMKWGVRRYIDDNGSLTDAGKKRYSGKHGSAKYVYDTNKAFTKRRKINAYGTHALAAGVGIVNAYGANHAGESIGKQALVGLGSAGLILASGKAATLEWNARNIRYIENNPAMEPQLDNARRYLRSQGIDA